MLTTVLPFILAFAAAQSTSDPQNATAYSLLYGYPLLAWQNFYPSVLSAVGVNTFLHARQLDTAANRTVVRPNVDTLYSTLVYDLSQANLEIDIPDVPADSFKLFSWYDPFGDNFANIGSSAFYAPGKYLLRPSYQQASGNLDIRVADRASAEYIGYVNSPTPYGAVLVRWGVNATNMDQVHDWQDQTVTRLVVPSKDMVSVPLPQLQSLVDVYNENRSPARNVMNLLARFLPPNAPSDVFAAAGIQNSSYTTPSSVVLRHANSTAVKEIAAAASDPSNFAGLNNGWDMPSPSIIGTYGSNYAFRALIGATGYLALQNPFAIYPMWSNKSAQPNPGEIKIGPNEALLFTFSCKPPLMEAGFWSLTAYGDDNFLIHNSRDVYALGDRSELAYPDGSQIYNGSASNTNDVDGFFQILVQPKDVVPPTNWTSNWLPAPAGGGIVITALRFYGAKKPLLDGSYVYPSVSRISAKGSDNSTGTSGVPASISTGAPAGSSSAASTATSAPETTSTGGCLSLEVPKGIGLSWLAGLLLFAMFM